MLLSELSESTTSPQAKKSEDISSCLGSNAYIYIGTFNENVSVNAQDPFETMKLSALLALAIASQTASAHCMRQ